MIFALQCYDLEFLEHAYVNCVRCGDKRVCHKIKRRDRMGEHDYGSRDIARAAIKMAISDGRDEEKGLQEKYKNLGVYTCATDYGGEFLHSVAKIVERTVVSAKREGVIGDSHLEQGAVAGAAHEALAQISDKAIGLSVGGKIGIARYKDHISVAVFFAVGLLNLDEVAMGMGHRAV